MEKGRGRISVMRVIRNTLVLLLVSLCILTPRLFPESSDTGADQARILYELGVLPKYDGVYLARTVAPKDAEAAVLRLLGSGDANGAQAFYRYLKLETAPDLIFPPKQDSLTQTQAYAMLLGAIGYSAQEDAVLENAMAAGFGFMREVRDSGEALTNGTFAIMLYETLLLRPPAAEFPVYRILAYLNSDFKASLLENGLYDDIPEEYVPLFNNGTYKPDSFAKLPGTEGRCEWAATYLETDSTYITAYIEGLLTGDWSREGTYTVEGDAPATIELLYRPLSSESTQELGLVVKYYEAGTVEWALFLN